MGFMGFARTLAGTADATGPTCLPSLAQLLQTTIMAPSISTLFGEARRGEPHTSHAAFMLVDALKLALKASPVQTPAWRPSRRLVAVAVFQSGLDVLVYDVVIVLWLS